MLHFVTIRQRIKYTEVTLLSTLIGSDIVTQCPQLQNVLFCL